MNLSEIKSVITRNPAWVSSLFTAASSLFIPFIIAGIGSLFGNLLGFSSQELIEFDGMVDSIGYLCTGIAVAIMCFFICKAHPKSVWHTPIINNGMTLLMAGNYFSGNLQLSTLLLTLGVGWILSIIAAILGSLKGRRLASS